ncbi:MAG: toll/interleukin-1 receptor domain-containing protein [Planctomycetes bacterium]|nr:toll/interleukin-1 receptor domain-containing protein [Planctomycetota bacterium]
MTEKNKKNVFISYSRQDDFFVGKLVHDLRSSGINIWHDIAQISPGENWQKAVEKGIGQASVLLYISSRNSIYSKWVEHELNAFFKRGGIVIPVVIDDEGEMNILNNPLLSKTQYIDFRKDYNSVIQPLERALMLTVGHDPSLSSEKHKTKGYVFLSYAEEDSIFLSDLRKFLKNHGYAYWDYEESDRDYHAQLFLELEGVIRDATATLSILSPAWKKSSWTIKEYLFSEEVGTPVFLLKVKELGPTLVIAGVPHIDFTKEPMCGFSKLSKELQRKKL